MADYSPDADQPDPDARAGRSRALDGHRQAGELRLAVLRHARDAVPRLRLRHRDVGAGVQLRGAGQRLAAQHRPPGAAAGGSSRRSSTPTTRRRSSRSWATGGIGPMAGPAYDYSARNRSRVKWPEYYDGKPLFYEWTRDYVKEFSLTAGNDVRRDRRRRTGPGVRQPDGHGVRAGRRALRPGVRHGLLRRDPEAQLSRIDFTRGNRTPVPVVTRRRHDRARAADGEVLQRRHGRSRRRRPALRLGLRRRRPRGLAVDDADVTPTPRTATTRRR